MSDVLSDQTLENVLLDCVRRHRGTATIHAVETGDETVYVLLREGMPPVSAYWPHPLEELCPHAERVTTEWGPAPPPFAGIVISHGRIRHRG